MRKIEKKVDTPHLSDLLRTGNRDEKSSDRSADTYKIEVSPRLVEDDSNESPIFTED